MLLCNDMLYLSTDRILHFSLKSLEAASKGASCGPQAVGNQYYSSCGARLCKSVCFVTGSHVEPFHPTFNIIGAADALEVCVLESWTHDGRLSNSYKPNAAQTLLKASATVGLESTKGDHVRALGCPCLMHVRRCNVINTEARPLGSAMQRSASHLDADLSHCMQTSLYILDGLVLEQEESWTQVVQTVTQPGGGVC